MRTRLVLAALTLATAAVAPFAPHAGAVTPSPEYVGVAPARYLDTRPGLTTFDGGFSGLGRISGNADIVTLPVAGRGDVPADVLAVSLNVTVTGATANGHLTVWPCGAEIPTTSNLNYTAGQTVANAVVSGTAFDGTVCLYAKSPVHAVVDVVGYLPITSSYRPLVPVRLYDSRAGTCDGPWTSDEILNFQYPLWQADGEEGCTSPYDGNYAEVPADARAAMLNITAVDTAQAGYVSTATCGVSDTPRTSTLNFDGSGQVVPNLAIATVTSSGVGDPGSLCFQQKANGHLVLDAFGYFPADAAYTAIRPERLVDSRPGHSTGDGLSAGYGRSARFAEVEFEVGGRLDGTLSTFYAAVVLNVTVTGSDQPGWVAVYPCGTDPATSTVNFAAGQTVANAAIVSPGANGTFCYKASQPVNVIVDLQGWF